MGAVVETGVALRAYTGADAPFVFATWLRSYLSEGPAVRHVPRPVYMREHRELIERLLDAGTACLLAVAGDDPELIFGWAAVGRAISKPVLHYVYVKDVYRRMGIARRLLDELEVRDGWWTHYTPTGAHLARARRLTLNPYITGAPS